MSAILCDRPEDVLAAFRELAAITAAEDAREMQYEGDLLKAELYRVLEALYEGRITFEAAGEACRILDATASDPLLSQEHVERLWALCADGHITWRELLLLVDIAQNDAMRAKAEFFKPVERETVEDHEEQLVQSINERLSKEAKTAEKPERGSCECK